MRDTYFDLPLGCFVAEKPMHNFFVEGENSKALFMMLDREWPEVQPMAFHSSIRRDLLEALVQYIRLHLESLREIKSLSILHEVFH